MLARPRAEQSCTAGISAHSTDPNVVDRTGKIALLPARFSSDLVGGAET
jgi:hypothetical protein